MHGISLMKDASSSVSDAWSALKKKMPALPKKPLVEVSVGVAQIHTILNTRAHDAVWGGDHQYNDYAHEQHDS